MNKFRGVRRSRNALLLLGLLACITSPGAAADPQGHVAQRLDAAPNNHVLRPSQWCVEDWARDYGKAVGLPETFEAIVLQESSAGEFRVNPLDPSYGDAGILLSTAQEILGQTPSIQQLENDDELNLRIGAEHLRRCAARFGSWRRAVACYNHGEAGAAALTDADVDADDYVHKIIWRLGELRAYRQRPSTCPRD